MHWCMTWGSWTPCPCCLLRHGRLCDARLSPRLEVRYSLESDVLRYGVVIAQLVTGRFLTDQIVMEDGDLLPTEAFDPALRGSGYEDEILRAMKVVVSCSNWRPKQRPTISEALEMLLQIRNPDTVPENDDVPTADRN